MTAILHTARLTLRHFTLADAPFILEIMNTPGYLRWIADQNVRTLAQAEEQLAERLMAGYTTRGWGNLLVTETESGLPIGFISLVERAYLPAPDIGYAFLPAFTGWGYAFEAAQAVLHYAHNTLQLPVLTGVTLPDNAASVKLLRKLGGVESDHIADPETGEELWLFRFEKK